MDPQRTPTAPELVLGPITLVPYRAVVVMHHSQHLSRTKSREITLRTEVMKPNQGYWALPLGCHLTL